MKPTFFLLALCLFFTFACEEQVEPRADQQIELNSAFSLKPPQKALSEELKIEVLKIDDSRCPADVQCSWEGEVSVKLGVHMSGKAEEVTLTLHNPALDGKNTAVLGDFRITLEWVSLPPSHKSKWGLQDYDVRLVVSRI